MSVEHIIVFGHRGVIGQGVVDYLGGRNISFTAVSTSRCDLTDYESVSSFLDMVQDKNKTPLRIVMLSVVGKFTDNTIVGYSKNICMAANLIRALDGRECASFVFASSTEVYGIPTTLPLSEKSPVQPVDWYGLAKAASENMFMMAHGLAHHVSMLRLPGVYNLDPRGTSVVDRLYQKVISGQEVVLHHNGTPLRDFVYVDDLSRLLLDLSQRDVGVGVLNVASGIQISMKELIVQMAEATGMQPDLWYEPGDPARKFDLGFDIAKLAKECPGAVPRAIHDVLKQQKKQSGIPAGLPKGNLS